MRKIFPIITFLITISLLGIIFFQFLWLKSAKEIKEQQLFEPYLRKPITLGQEKLMMDFTRLSVLQRFTKNEMRDIIRTAFNKNMLADVPFEFAVTENSLSGDQVESEHFFKYYSDTLNNKLYSIPLQGSSGSSMENITAEEFLVVIVPHERSIILKELVFFIIGAILFTLLLRQHFFLP